MRWILRSGPFLAFLVLSSGCAEPVAAPKAFADYNAKDGSFSCKYPEGWKVEGGGGRGDYACTTFSKGNAQIRVESDLAGSLHADMAKAQGNPFGGEEAEPPVAKVHELKKKATSEEFSNYKEREPKPFKSSTLGEGRKAIFVAENTLGGKIYGYRATLLTNDKRITVLCQCNATDWQVLRPAFDKVIESVGH